MAASGKPKVLTYHTFVERYGFLYAGKVGSSLMLARSRTVANKMDAIISPSRVMEQKLRQYGVEKPIYVIPTGIEIPDLLFTKEDLAGKYDFSLDTKVLVYVGRVSKEKNIEAILRVVKLLKGKKVNAVLLVVGPGDIDEMKRKAKKMGIKGNVIFTGPLMRENAQKHYGGADIAVFSSQTETQGLTIGEAMAAGIPVIALDSPIREEFYPEDVAITVQNESDFADAVLYILNNPAERRKKIEAAKRFAADIFSKKRMIEKQIALFSAVIKGSPL
jgi:1,2-diacylglycerol 3-alpha-glucosyltransferase